MLRTFMKYFVIDCSLLISSSKLSKHGSRYHIHSHQSAASLICSLSYRLRNDVLLRHHSVKSLGSTRMVKTRLIYQAAEHQNTTSFDTVIQLLQTYDEVPESIQSLYKPSIESHGQILVLVTESSIFHPQGGGQPSDAGKMIIKHAAQQEYTVLMVRMLDGVVYHFGRLTDNIVSYDQFAGVDVRQLVDGEKRLLFSRLHTAGHVLGTATRSLLETKVDNFDELKASHFPDSAACEFQGLIDGKYKSVVQQAVDQLVAEDRDVRIEWWTKDDFNNHNLSRLLPEDNTWADIATSVDEDGKDVDVTELDHSQTRIRVVNIVGAEVYPCGGTHCRSTRPCGPVKVKKISRAKGNSRISYQVE